MKKMIFEIEVEVPDDIEHFIGVELRLQNAEHPYGWKHIFGGVYRRSKIRDGKHLSITKGGYTVISVGERTPEELKQINKRKDNEK